MERIAGLILSGMAVRLAGAALALYIGVEVAAYVSSVFETASAVLEVTSKGVG